MKPPTDPNWWRPILAPIAVTSALIVAACISGLPSITCVALAKTYSAAIYNFGFSALLAASLFLFCMCGPGALNSKKLGPGPMPPHVVYIAAILVAGSVLGASISRGIDGLDSAIAECYPVPKVDNTQV